MVLIYVWIVEVPLYYSDSQQAYILYSNIWFNDLKNSIVSKNYVLYNIVP